jgi:serine/threonine-protein kinase RsbT
MGSETHDALAQLLQKYLSPINARGTLSRALGDLQLTAERLEPVHLPRLLGRLEPAVKLFVSSTEFRTFQQAVQQLQYGPRSGNGPVVRHIGVINERDIAEVLMVVRELCRTAAVKSFVMQTTLTVVSELARNIVSYTPGGFIELSLEGTPPRLKVVASDTGPGIPNLNEIFAGRYRSKTGLGRGLLGVKQLASKFDIQTGPKGTTISLEFRL